MRKLAVVIVMFFVSNFLNAQETKKNRGRSFEKAEAAFDKAFDGLFKTKKKESSEPKTNTEKPKPEAKEKSESSGFGGFSFGGKPKASYSFGSSMTMKLTIKSAKDKKSTTMRNKYMFADDMTAMAIKFLSSDNPDMAKASANMDAIVMDFDQKKMFTFLNNDGKKTLMGIGFKGDDLEKYVEKENSKISVTKTNQNKTIAGYKCDGYIIKSEDQKEDILMWISQNRVGEMAKMAQKMSQGSSPFGGKSASKNYMAYNAHPELVKIAEQGRMVLGYTVKSEKGDTTEMEFEEIKPNDKSSFGTGDYKSMF